MHLSIRDTLAEVRFWVRLGFKIPVTLGMVVAHDDTRIFRAACRRESYRYFDVDHF